jgi:hypothetical protein
VHPRDVVGSALHDASERGIESIQGPRAHRTRYLELLELHTIERSRERAQRRIAIADYTLDDLGSTLTKRRVGREAAGQEK